MSIDVTCFNCRKIYNCNQKNSKIVGPLVETKCPACSEKVVKNLSAFLCEQAPDLKGRLVKAATMISMGQKISSVVNEERAFVKRNK